MKNTLKKNRKDSERGQAIIIIAAALVGMIAIVGLMIDGGIMLIEYARLKRAIDAASVAAASQYRLGFVGADLQKAGEEFLKFNQSDSTVTIATCNYPGTTWDDSLCPPAAGPTPRKLVRVTATRHVSFGFMKVVGINGTDISATSVGEAASLDLVLAIDTSASMAYETTGSTKNQTYQDANCVIDGTHPIPNDCVDPDKSDQSSILHPYGDDPRECNTAVWAPKVLPADPGYPAYQAYLAKRCEPLGSVIDVALDFVSKQFFPYDRIAIVTSTDQSPGGSRLPDEVTGFNNNLDASGNPTSSVQDFIRNLKVNEPSDCPSDTSSYKGTCIVGAVGSYISQNCPILTRTTPMDPTTCGSSNIGGLLFKTGDEFAYGRQEAFWVAIVLYGGAANATSPTTETPPLKPDGFCPGPEVGALTTWSLSGGSGTCRDEDPLPAGFNWATYKALPDNNARSNYWPADDEINNTTRHKAPTLLVPSPLYDADDYARDGADFIASKTKGQNTVLFSICMGVQCVLVNNQHDPASGQRLGKYMAYHAGDDLTVTPKVYANHGLYAYAANATALTDIFLKIAKNIGTRISQ